VHPSFGPKLGGKVNHSRLGEKGRTPPEKKPGKTKPPRQKFNSDRRGQKHPNERTKKRICRKKTAPQNTTEGHKTPREKYGKNAKQPNNKKTRNYHEFGAAEVKITPQLVDKVGGVGIKSKSN